MADAKKPVRLSKAAKEFNLGIGTIVEFLESKGIQVEAKPNTKLDPEVYALVRGNFQGDKDAKEAAKRSTVSRERESISIERAKKQAKEEPKEDTAIDLSIFKKDEPGPKAEPVIEEPAAAGEKPLAENLLLRKRQPLKHLQSQSLKSQQLKKRPLKNKLKSRSLLKILLQKSWWS